MSDDMPDMAGPRPAAPGDGLPQIGPDDGNAGPPTPETGTDHAMVPST